MTVLRSVAPVITARRSQLSRPVQLLGICSGATSAIATSNALQVCPTVAMAQSVSPCDDSSKDVSCDLGYCDNSPNPGYPRCRTSTTCDKSSKKTACSGQTLAVSSPNPELCHGTTTCGVTTEAECAALCGSMQAKCAQFEDYCNFGDSRCLDQLNTCTCHSKQWGIPSVTEKSVYTTSFECKDRSGTTCGTFGVPDGPGCSGKPILVSSPDAAKCIGTDTCGLVSKEECSKLCADAGASCAKFSDYCVATKPAVKDNCIGGKGTCQCFDDHRINNCVGCTEGITYASNC